MPRRKREPLPGPSGPRRVNRGLVLMGDVRPLPLELGDGDAAVRPSLGIWVRADDGALYSSVVSTDEDPVPAFVDVLLDPTAGDRVPPGETVRGIAVVSPPGPAVARSGELPRQVIVFDEDTARRMQAVVAPFGVEVAVSPPFEPFEQVFDLLFDMVDEAAAPTLDLPDELLRPLCAAADRLWRAKPWGYAFDEPPVKLTPRSTPSASLYAAILGANGEVLGVALYGSLADYRRSRSLGEAVQLIDASGGEPDLDPDQLADFFRHRVLLVSFDPKSEAYPEYRDQLARCGWARRPGVVPTFVGYGGGEPAAPFSPGEALIVAPALAALVGFCERDRDKIAAGAFPIRDTVATRAPAGTELTVDVSMPPEPARRRARR